MRLLLLIALLLCSLAQAAETRQLVAHSQVTFNDPGLSQQEWQWIYSKKTLRYAAWRPIKPPFEAVSGRQDYSGIIADYLGIIAASLRIPLTVVLYDSREEALQALRLGTADIIAFAQPAEPFTALTLSRPWISSPAVLVSRQRNIPQSDARLRIGIDQDDVYVTGAQKQFSSAQLIPFGYARQAMKALTFGNLDFYLGSQITADYLIGQEDLQGLNVQLRADAPDRQFSFAALPHQRSWISIIDKLMAHIPRDTHAEIQRRWRGNMASDTLLSQPALSSLEKKWIQQHRQISVSIANDNFPLSYTDRRGQLQGIVPDLLNALQQRTGLTFAIHREPYIADALNAVQQGESELLAATSLNSAQHYGLLTSRALFFSSLVQIVSQRARPGATPQRLAYLRGEQPEEELRQYYPDSQLIGVHSWRQGLEKIVQGEADAIVMPLIIAGPMIAEGYRQQLTITQGQWSEPSRIVMATSGEDYTLAGILDKTLMSLPPEELNALVSRRREPPASTAGVMLPSYVPLWLLPLAVLPCLLAAVALLWRARRQQRLLDRAHQRAAQKSAWLSTLGHEIRNPVSAINGMLELLRHQPDSSRPDRESLRVAHEAAGSLLSLTEEILDFTGLEANRLILRPEAVSLRALLESVAAIHEQIARQKNLRLRLAIDAVLNRKVLVDPLRLRQILNNLLGNAVKFTASGDITLEALCDEIPDGQLQLRIRVQDSGPGIDRATAERLFQPFSQGNSAARAQGSGLGLYISRSLARMMGGDIRLQTAPGTGSTFTVTLQLSLADDATDAAAPAQESSTSAHQMLRVLVVDDQPANRFLLLRQLRLLGHEAIECPCSTEAEAQVAACQPQLVITDCYMPELDGFTLARQLKARWPALTVWGITGDRESATLDAAIQAGMTHCFARPLALKALQQTLRQLALPLCEPQLWSPAALPAELMADGNYRPFLLMQIEALDDALRDIASWRQGGQPPLSATLHRLYGGVILLGSTQLATLCEQVRGESAGLDELVSLAESLRRELIGTTENDDNLTRKQVGADIEPPLVKAYDFAHRGCQGWPSNRS